AGQAFPKEVPRDLPGLIGLRQGEPRQLQARGRFHHRHALPNLPPAPAKHRGSLPVSARLNDFCLDLPVRRAHSLHYLRQHTHADISRNNSSAPASPWRLATVEKSLRPRPFILRCCPTSANAVRAPGRSALLITITSAVSSITIFWSCNFPP